MKRSLLVAALLLIATLIVCAAASAWWLWGKQYEIIITEAELQEKAGEKFPLSKKYLLIFGVTYKDPVVILEQNANHRIKVGLTAETEFFVNKNKIMATGNVSGNLRYDSTRGAFFLDAMKVESFDVSGFPDKYKEKATEAMSEAINEYYSRYPVYTLKDDNLKHIAAKLALKSVIINDKKMIVVLGLGL
jgi:Protein of unknown function (DUF1439)